MMRFKPNNGWFLNLTPVLFCATQIHLLVSINGGTLKTIHFRLGFSLKSSRQLGVPPVETPSWSAKAHLFIRLLRKPTGHGHGHLPDEDDRRHSAVEHTSVVRQVCLDMKPKNI